MLGRPAAGDLRLPTAAQRLRTQIEQAPRPPARQGGKRLPMGGADPLCGGPRQGTPATALRRRAGTPSGIAEWRQALAEAQPLLLCERPVSAPRSPTGSMCSFAPSLSSHAGSTLLRAVRPVTGAGGGSAAFSNQTALPSAPKVWRCGAAGAAARDQDPPLAAPLWQTYSAVRADRANATPAHAPPGAHGGRCGARAGPAWDAWRLGPDDSAVHGPQMRMVSGARN
eukprot:TRINITY_DN17384_c0_g1_i1.p2 TRINITY_DN17384_c0_g1~~TRINITY_DN17384_c0_g1_i1.p2  ORF type:complete len:261 (+),score=42.91 TRINITY_DN17384_c0_g1_i1:107-784(+)